MRVALIGSASDRARLRTRLDASLIVVGEFASVALALRLRSGQAPLDVDAFLLAPAAGEDDTPEPLTPREVEVLELLAEGLPNKAIAARLGISDQTVKFHVAAISGKLGARNRTDAVRRGVRRGLITF
jgi:two-component system, NarL family, nitrate/nitrite response regulator NarL